MIEGLYRRGFEGGRFVHWRKWEKWEEMKRIKSMMGKVEHTKIKGVKEAIMLK